MQISRRGMDFIRQEEGERLTGYKDSRGIPTIGVGHTGKVNSLPVSIGMTITPEQSVALLKDDLAWVEHTLASAITIGINQNQYDALCSLIFNIGATAFKNSTLLRLLNQGLFAAAADEFLKWRKAGRDPDILLPRRQRERAYFLS
ncbi:lysozyme (plasmid) [Enterobacter pasteurii]|uniref:lysozyme n=1 Tax=Enterobacter pasteurii TaxID=3029761 RepID=UPI0011DC9F50|nr:lysozyme [Enterobacter pasteurii]QLA70597.1 lysozyme [Enterobacter pasteurii]